MNEQQRLDKVLSKFNMCDSGYLKCGPMIYNKSCFELNGMIEIKIDTVELILRDMEWGGTSR